MSLNWSDWHDITQPANYGENAVYRIRLMNQQGPAMISRFLGADSNGILCIGKTNDMEKRRRQFVRGLKGKFGHSEGYLMHILQKVSPFSALYANTEWQYSFAKVGSGEEEAVEAQEIKAYVKEFGEVPPLNSAIPDRYGDW